MRTISNAGIGALAVDFLVDHAELPREAAANILHVHPTELDAIRAGRVSASLSTARTIKQIAAIQSLLLDSYTPDGMKRWLTTANIRTEGRAPRETLRGIDPDRVSKVLKACFQRATH